MRRAHLLPLLFVALMLAATSCSRSAGTSPTGLEQWRDSTNAAGPAEKVDTVVPMKRLPPLTSQGIGAIRIGVNIATIPQEFFGVYDSLAISSEEAYEQPFRQATGFLNGTPTMEVLAIDNNDIVDAITILTPAITVNIDNVNVGVGTKVAAAKRLNGVTYAPRSEMEGERLEYRDIRFYIDGDSIYALAVGNTL